MAVKPEALPSVDNDLTIPVEPPPRPNRRPSGPAPTCRMRL